MLTFVDFSNGSSRSAGCSVFAVGVTVATAGDVQPLGSGRLVVPLTDPASLRAIVALR
jgi:hypothetical protein